MEVPASGKIQLLYCFSSTTDMYDTRQKHPTRFRARYAPYSQPKVALLLGKIKPDPFFLISYNPFNNKMLTQHSTILWGSLQSIQRMIYTLLQTATVTAPDHVQKRYKAMFPPPFKASVGRTVTFCSKNSVACKGNHNVAHKSMGIGHINGRHDTCEQSPTLHIFYFLQF